MSNLEEAPNLYPDKLYSVKAVGAATFIGGPIAAGIMARRNLLNLKRDKAANLALSLSIGFTLLIILGLILTPSGIVERIPGVAIAAGYIALATRWFQRMLGRDLELQESVENGFYSGWKTFGVGLLSMLLSIVLALLIVGTGLNSPQDKAYIDGCERIIETLRVDAEYLELANKEEVSDGELLEFIDASLLPAWEDALKAVGELEEIRWIDSSLTEQRKALRSFVELNLEYTHLLREHVLTDDDDDEILEQLERLLEGINSIDLSVD